MKLILFTPVVYNSAIGRMASLVARKLISYGHEVVVVRTENNSHFNRPIHDFGAETISWYNSSQIQEIAKTADAFIYQIGNSYEFHQGCLEWLQKLKGIVCLHDFFLGHLFQGWAQDHLEEANVILHTWYGPQAVEQFFWHAKTDSFVEETHTMSPMTEWICSMAHSVITHSSWGIESVLNACPGPVCVVPLPYEPSALTQDRVREANKFRILTVGHINKNKRAASVIIALGQSRWLRKKIIYQLVGCITSSTSKELSALAKKNKVKLVISGEVDNVALAEAINQADVITCFRWPALEAASASSIEALLCGKPTMVTSTGFYNEIPDDCTIKINPKNEIAEIKAALEKLKENSEFLNDIGKRGQQWARKTFTVDNYVLKLIEVALSTTRTSAVNNALTYFTKVMYSWGANKELIGKEYIIKPLSIFDGVS